MKKSIIFAGIVLFLGATSCGRSKKTAADINLKEISTPCEWYGAFELTVKEYHQYVQTKERELAMSNSPASKKEVELFNKQNNFYIELMDQLLTLQSQKGWSSDAQYQECGNKEARISQLKGIVNEIEMALSSKVFDQFGNPKPIAIKYLKCLMNKDYDKAKLLATKETAANLDMMKSLGTDFGVYMVKDVTCSLMSPKEAICFFCCTKDTSFKYLEMRKEDGKWLAHQPKEVPPVDTTATDTDINSNYNYDSDYNDNQ